MRVRILFLMYTLLAFPLFAQDWNWANRYGAIGADALEAMAIGPSGEVLLGGSFEGQLMVGAENLEAFAGRDAFLARLDEHGNVDWALSGGGPSNEVSIEVAFDGEGNTIWLGQYWIEGFFGQDTITAGSNSKAYFMAKYDPAGALLWVKSINGSATKVVNDFVLDALGDIYLTGYFNDSLMIDDFTLTSTHLSDAFMIKLSSEGEVIRGLKYGDFGWVRSQKILQTSDGDLVLAGIVEGGISFGPDTLVSVTTDFDLFVAKLDTLGTGIWGRIGTGVFDNLVFGFEADSNDDLYVTGNFVGVLNIGGLEILTPSFTENLFLLKLDASGEALWARGLNDQLFNEASSGMDLSFKDDLVMMTGQFSDELLIDDLSLNSSGGTRGFIAGFDRMTGLVKRLSKIGGNGQTSGVRIETGPTGLIYIGGLFLGEVFFDDRVLTSEGQTDCYVAQSTDLFTGIDLDFLAEKTISVYPNPVTSVLYIATEDAYFEGRIYDRQGRIVRLIKQELQVSVHDLIPGIYYLRYYCADGVASIPFVKY